MGTGKASVAMTTIDERNMVSRWKREMQESRQLRPTCSGATMARASCALRRLMTLRRGRTVSR